jgi:hypothetical protein
MVAKIDTSFSTAIWEIGDARDKEEAMGGEGREGGGWWFDFMDCGGGIKKTHQGDVALYKYGCWCW